MRRWNIRILFAVLMINVGFVCWNWGNATGFTERRLLTGQLIAVGLLGAAFAAHIATRLPERELAFLWTRRAIFVVVLAMLGAWYLALYPGIIIGTDTSMMLSSVVGKDGYSPFSAFWNNFFGGLYSLTGSLQVIPIFNMVLCAWTIANLLALTASMGIDRYLVALVVFLLFFLPALPCSALLWSHDTTAALLRLALISYAIWLCWTFHNQDARAAWGPACIVSLLSTTCGLTRSENFLLVLIVPGVLLYYRLFSWRMALSCFAGSVLAIVMFSGLVGRQLYGNVSKIDYSLSLLANPARYFYHNDFVSDTRANDLALLEKVFGRDWLLGTRFPYAPYHTKGLVFKSIDEATMRSLRATLLSIAQQNPRLALEDRAILAWTLISAAAGADYHSLNSDFGMDEHVKALYLNQNQVAIYNGLALSARRRPEGLHWVAQRIQAYFDPRRENRPLLAVFTWTLVPALACLFIALPGVRHRRLSALASVFMLPCVAAVILTAPAAHFKYVADVYVMGWFLPLLLYAERNRYGNGAGPNDSGPTTRSTFV